MAEVNDIVQAAIPAARAQKLALARVRRQAGLPTLRPGGGNVALGPSLDRAIADGEKVNAEYRAALARMKKADPANYESNLAALLAAVADISDGFND